MANKFVISEREKNRILNLHTERMLLEREGVTTEQTTTASTVTQQTSVAPTTQQTTTAPTNPTAGRWDTAACPAGKANCVLKGLQNQMKVNDWCGPEILNKTLESYPKGRVGQPGAYKLLEDGVWGKTSNAVYTSCKQSMDTKIANLKSAGGGGGQATSGTTAQIIPVGGNLSANDIQTLIS